MHIRSHVDPVLFVTFLHVNSDKYDDDFRALVDSYLPHDINRAEKIMDAIVVKQKKTMEHERYHFWQGLRLPFLNFYATVSFREFLLGIKSLSQLNKDWVQWENHVSLPDKCSRIDRIIHVSGNRTGELLLSNDGRSKEYEFSIELSITEMLENAATIYDYQVSCEKHADISDPEKFDRWVKRNPAYLKIYYFLSSVFNSKSIALRTIIPLINSCFHTSFPEKAFVEMVARVWANFTQDGSKNKSFLDQKEPCRWSEVFKSWLAELNYDSPYGSTPDSIDLSSGLFFHMGSEYLGNAIGGGIQHIYLGAKSTEWLKRSKTIPGLDYYIDMPGYYLNTDAHKFAILAEPPIHIVRIFSKNGSNKVFMVGDGLVESSFIDKTFGSMKKNDFNAVILDILTAYGAFRRSTGYNYTQVSRICYHNDCSHYEGNYCNSYPLVPLDPKDCGFHARLTSWITTNRRLQ